eukprot:1273003-Amphidinium_carterae.7
MEIKISTMRNQRKSQKSQLKESQNENKVIEKSEKYQVKHQHDLRKKHQRKFVKFVVLDLTLALLDLDIDVILI